MVHAEIAARLHRPEERRLLGLHPAECPGVSVYAWTLKTMKGMKEYTKELTSRPDSRTRTQ